ncbi:MAG: coxB [Alphaproteobacteria bacterium]|nr:coxB [Alphaproteobacteria bacterium]
MPMSRFLTFLAGVFPALLLLPHHALAQLHTEDIWATWLPEPVSPTKLRIHAFNDYVNGMVFAIVVVVAILLVYTLVRFRRNKNPTPSRTTHNVRLEIIWTLIPCLIVLAIVIPSLRLLYFTDRTTKPDLTLKVTGYQWYWGYAYPDQGIEEFSLNLIPNEESDAKKEFAALRDLPAYQRLLSTYDLASGKPAFVVLPVKKNIRVLTTGNDVIHSWAMPAFGVKKDAVPGRLNETWFRVDRPGIYYGQCSEICGINHAYMPIEIRVVPDDQFARWTELMKTDQPAAMDYIQTQTIQFAHRKIEDRHLTLPGMWQELKQAVQK